MPDNFPGNPDTPSSRQMFISEFWVGEQAGNQHGSYSWSNQTKNNFLKVSYLGLAVLLRGVSRWPRRPSIGEICRAALGYLPSHCGDMAIGEYQISPSGISYKGSAGA